jgi:hypothetical protein
MTAFNAVRFRAKVGREHEFLDAHKKVQADWPGLAQRFSSASQGLTLVT